MNATYTLRIRPVTAEKLHLEISRRHVAGLEKYTLDQMIDYAIGLAARESLHKSRDIDKSPVRRRRASSK